MKKTLLSCLLLCSFITYAEETETHELPPITGTWYNTSDFSSLSSGVVQPQLPNRTMYGTTWSPSAHAEMLAAQAAGRKKALAAAKQKCIDNFKELDNLNYEDSIDLVTTRQADCKSVFAHDPAVMEICTTDAINHYDGSLDGQADLLEVREQWCEKRFAN